jgi:hypothetical protein
MVELDIGTYYWHVEAVDNADNSSEWSITNSFYIDVGDSFGRATTIDITSAYSNTDYVGIGDAYDYYKFTSDGNGEFDFCLTGLDSETTVHHTIWNWISPTVHRHN